MKLTGLDDKELAARIAATTPGMAHLATTGPAGTFCWQCRWWNPDLDSLRPGRVRRDAEGFLKNRRCRKYSALKQGAKGRGVKPETRSCRHFERASKVHELQVTVTDGLE